MDFLEAPHADGVPLPRSDCFGCGFGGADGRDAGHAIGNGSPSNCLFVTEGMRARSNGIYDKVQGSAFQKIYCIGPAFIDFEYGAALYADSLNGSRGAPCCDELVSEFVQTPSYFRRLRFIAVVDADEDRAFQRQRSSGTQLRLWRRLRRSFHRRP